MAELIARYRIRFTVITPWIGLRMVEAGIDRRHDLSSVQILACGSAPMPPMIANALLAMMQGARISLACAQSEAGPALIVNTYDAAQPMSTRRLAGHTDLHVVDHNGNDALPGELGEDLAAQSRTEAALSGQSRTERRHSRRRVVSQRGLGWFGAEGGLYFFDRAVDTMRVAGRRVSSAEVEYASLNPGSSMRPQSLDFRTRAPSIAWSRRSFSGPENRSPIWRISSRQGLSSAGFRSNTSR